MNKNIYPFIADEIKSHLKKQAISYKQLGDCLGVSEKTIARSLNNHQSLSIERLSLISNIINVPLLKLLAVAEKQMSRVHYFTQEQDMLMAETLCLYDLLCLLYDEYCRERLAHALNCTLTNVNDYLMQLESVGLIAIHSLTNVSVLVPKHTMFPEPSQYIVKKRQHTLNKLIQSCNQTDNISASIKLVYAQLSEEEYVAFLSNIKQYLSQLVTPTYYKPQLNKKTYTIALLSNETVESAGNIAYPLSLSMTT